MLQRAGHVVHACQDGQEALDAFSKQPKTFDRVVLDVRMPRLDGCEALRGMRQLRPAAPAILTSGYPQGAQLGRLGDGVHFLPKPYFPSDLLHLVQQIVAAGNR
jgi:CheY-like chemotaxis protein